LTKRFAREPMGLLDEHNVRLDEDSAEVGQLLVPVHLLAVEQPASVPCEDLEVAWAYT
jgi:hypothetical protein